MTDSNDKLDDKNSEINADEHAKDLPSPDSELDAQLLEAAQRWADEFNPELGTDSAEEFSLSKDNTGEETRKKRSKKKPKSEAAFAAESPSAGEASPSSEIIEESLSYENHEGGEATEAFEELLEAAIESEAEAEIEAEDLEDVLAHFDAKAQEADILAHTSETSAPEADADREGEALKLEGDAPDLELGLAVKKPKGRPKKDKELAAEASVEPEIVTDDRQGLMRWDEAINLEAQVEAILFAAPKPISVSEIAELLGDDDGNEPDHQVIDSITQQLLRLYKERNGGFRLEYDKGAGFQFRTVPAAAPIMERMFSSRQRPLSRAAHETLAIIAYRQPCTRADIEFIRGVDAGSIIKNLLERDLVACVGRKEDSGRPMLFGTTAEFMRVFRIQTLNDLPPLSAFQPASEAIIDAFQKIDRPDLDIDVEDFIGDESRSQPEISGDLSADFTKSDDSFEVREDGSDTSASTPAEIRRSGGIFDNEGFLSDGHENTEVALPTRDSITPGSGEDASRGPDQHQRKSGARAGDEDPT